jgi:hypothetical protein
MPMQESILVPKDNKHCEEIIEVIREIGKDYYDEIQTEIKYIITSEIDRTVRLRIFDPVGTFIFRKGKRYIIIQGENYLNHLPSVSMIEMILKDKLPLDKTPGLIPTKFFPEGEFEKLKVNRMRFFKFENFVW